MNQTLSTLSRSVSSVKPGQALGQALLYFRHRADLGQAEVGKHVGLNRVTVSRHEGGVGGAITLANLRGYAQVYGTTVAAIEQVAKAIQNRPPLQHPEDHEMFSDFLDRLVAKYEEREEREELNTELFARLEGRVGRLTAQRMSRIDALERSVIRSGATDADADWIRGRAARFLSTMLSNPPSESDDLEFDLYLDFVLRPLAEERIRQARHTTENEAEIPSSADAVAPLGEESSEHHGRRRRRR